MRSIENLMEIQGSKYIRTVSFVFQDKCVQPMYYFPQVKNSKENLPNLDINQSHRPTNDLNPSNMRNTVNFVLLFVIYIDYISF